MFFFFLYLKILTVIDCTSGFIEDSREFHTSIPGYKMEFLKSLLLNGGLIWFLLVIWGCSQDGLPTLPTTHHPHALRYMHGPNLAATTYLSWLSPSLWSTSCFITVCVNTYYREERRLLATYWRSRGLALTHTTLHLQLAEEHPDVVDALRRI